VTTSGVPRRVPLPAGFLFAVAAALAAAVLLWLGRGLTFFADEWAFIESRQIDSLDSLLRPHNEHWSTIPILLYRTLFAIVGLRSYLPYLALVILIHIAVAAGIFVLLRRAHGPWPALGGGLLVLLLGAGFENIFWAFQIGFVGSTAAGVWALVVLDGPASRRRMPAVALLLTLGVATSGMGLLFLLLVGVELGLDGARRRALLWLAVPALSYATWYLAYGRTGVDTYGRPYTVEAFARLTWFVPVGVADAIREATGLPEVVGIAVTAAVAVTIGWQVFRHRAVPSRTLGACAAILAEFALIGLVRGQLGSWAADYPRYAYTATILAIVGASPWVARLQLPTGRRARLGARVAGILALEALLVVNVHSLVLGAGLFQDRADLTRALVTVALRYDSAPAVVPDRSLVLVPSPSSLEAIVASAGSPTRDSLMPGVVPPIRPETMDDALNRLVGGAVPRVEAGAGATGAAGQGRSPGDCRTAVVDPGGRPVTLVRPPGASVYLRTDTPGTVATALARLAPPQTRLSHAFPLGAGAWYAIAVPDLGDGEPWTLAIWPADRAPLEVCG